MRDTKTKEEPVYFIATYDLTAALYLGVQDLKLKQRAMGKKLNLGTPNVWACYNRIAQALKGQRDEDKELKITVEIIRSEFQKRKDAIAGFVSD